MSSQLLSAIHLPWPTDWAELFQREAPLLVEIGFGGGEFLVDLARRRPECSVVGVEISAYSIRKGIKKIKTAGLTNARVVQGSANSFVQSLCRPGSISEMYINFPDPWPRAEHNRRRLISDDFLHLLATRIPAGGLLEIATDHADYAEAITECLQRTPYFESRLPAAFATEDEQRPRTKYELIGLEEGRVCHYYKWRRNEASAEDIFPPPQELPMPHIILSTPMSLAEIGQQFEVSHYTQGEVRVKLLEMFKSLSSDQLFVETYVSEQPLTQRVGLTIRHRAPQELVIGLHDTGFPRPTQGIQLAISFLANWAVGLHPEAKILKSNLKTTVEEMP